MLRHRHLSNWRGSMIKWTNKINRWKNLSQKSIMNIWTYSINKLRTASPPLDPGITKLNLKKDSNPSPLKCTLWPLERTKQLKTLSKKICRKDIFNLQNLQWRLHSFTLTKKTRSYSHARIVNIWMNGPSRMPTHFHLSPIYLINWRKQNISQNWTYEQDTTMFESGTAINERRYSKQNMAYMNLWSYFWTMQFTSNLPEHDGSYLQGLHKWWLVNLFHRQPFNICRNQRTTRRTDSQSTQTT